MSKSTILLFFAIIISSTVIAQDKITDSLKNVLAHSKADTSKVNTLIALSKSFSGSAPEVSLSYATQAKDLAVKLKFKKGQAYALKFIGIYYYNQAKTVETLDNWQQSLALFRLVKDKAGEASILSNIGSLYYNQADDANALEYYLQSLKIAEDIGDKLRMATALQNIGNVYLRKKATQGKALKYLLRALPLAEELKNHDAIVVTLTNLGEVYLTMGKVDSSLYYYQKGLAASNNNEEVSSAFILNNIGRAYAKKGNFDLAIGYQKQSVALAKKFNAKFFMGKSLLGLADTYSAKGDVQAALEAYKQAEPLLVEAHAVEELRDTYSGLTNAYAKLGNYNKAYTYQTLFGNFKDTIYNTETDKKLASLQFDFDLWKKQSEIVSLTKDQKLKDLDLQKQKTTRNALAVGFTLLLILAFVIYNGYRNKAKTNIILDKQKAQIENLMHNILPSEVATELQAKGSATPRHYDSVSVLFTDFKSFTSLADKLTPQELLEELNDSFIAFDDIIEKHGLEKIKTIGDAYMCAGGIPTPNETHAVDMVKAGLEMQQYITGKNKKRSAAGLPPWELRIGIHVGPVVAGVVGKKKYAYDIWGNTVNIASRMESNGAPGQVNISANTYDLVKGRFNCTHRGKIMAKNVGEIDMYFVAENAEREYIIVEHQIEKEEIKES
ncbi:MAG: hypothetical protein JWN76_2681 [Chitinophagaceae bacterium]|nr:hypothetical protein [Chitinophagaceae bacterium]